MNSKQPLGVTVTKYCFALLFCLALAPTRGRADVSLFLQESLGVSGEASSAGHTSIYFSNICAESPVQLRPCQPGEGGVVISLYAQFGANQPYEWIAIPLLSFLYGVENEDDIPLYVNGAVRTLLRESYRQKRLRGFIPDRQDGAIPPGRWQQMLVNCFNRDTYSFTLKTTAAEDAALIEKLNRLPNQNHFNAPYHNCADFAREVLNTYFPHATHRDVLNDFTMTSPKAVARSLTRYAVKRPERLFNITRYAQLAGPIRRSVDNRNYTEYALVSKKYLIPQLIFKQELLAVFAASYLLVGRFSVQQAYVAHATPEIAQLNLAALRLNQPLPPEPEQAALLASLGRDFSEKRVGAEASATRLDRSAIESRKESERHRVFGTKPGWEKYRAEFTPLLDKAIADGLFADEREVKTFFKDLELQSAPAFDAQGALLLRVNAYGREQMLGLTRGNILSSATNPQLAYKLLLAKVHATLKGKEKNREALSTFERDWELLLQLAVRSAATFQPTSARPPRFLVTPEKTTFGEKFKKVFVLLTH